MIALLFLLLQPGLAQGLQSPVPPLPVAGECSESVPIRSGQGLSPALVGPDGLAVCDGVVVPVSELAYLLQLEEYATAREKLHVLDIQLLETERDWYRDQYVTASKPPPWYDTPVAHRWTGRAETLLAITVVAVGLGYTYDVAGGSQ